MTRRPVRCKALCGLVAVAALAAAPAACAPVGPFAASPLRPGPDVAVRAFFGALARSDANTACDNVEPAERAACLRSFAGKQVSITGFRIARTVVRGDRALVWTLGRFCTAGGCAVYEDASIGVPGPHLSFSEAYAEAAIDPSDPAGELTRVGGHWYLHL